MRFAGCCIVLALSVAACGKDPPPTTAPSGVPLAPSKPPPEDPHPIQLAGAGDAFDYKIFFAAGSDEVRPESAAVLDELARELAEHPASIGIRVVGHVDRTEDSELSTRRADAVAAALRKRGVSQRVHAHGADAGEGRPACTDDPELCLARSRRVEFVLVVPE